MFQAAWCGTCRNFYNVFQNGAFYFKNWPFLKFATIDADKNDLPWQFTVESYPTIVYFPAK
uniref:Thioredoxin domain-containing protein n=1 Tax=Romanomermis culicivorax TaxID=13658 RepID=A0A915JM03_ROMCU